LHSIAIIIAILIITYWNIIIFVSIIISTHCNMKYKNIAINEAYNSRVEELAALFSKDNKGKLIEIMVDYFKTTGIDPRDLEVTTFKKEFKKLDDNISKLRETTVSFIRQQEKGF